MKLMMMLMHDDVDVADEVVDDANKDADDVVMWLLKMNDDESGFRCC